MHTESHPLAGKTVILNDTTSDPARGMVVSGEKYRIEDYWDRVSGGESWGTASVSGNMGAMQYRLRATEAGLPLDDDVVYGKIGGLGHLVHVSELGEVSA